VERFYNETPVMEFMYRRGQLLNLRWEKVSEDMFYRSLLSAVERVSPGTQLRDYTVSEVLPAFKPGKGRTLFVSTN